jgi:DNA-nicking Smr family endonuclease
MVETEMDTDDFDEDEPVSLPIDGVLDLHPFSPKDLRTLIPEYLEQCHARGILEIRIIHGKGIGNLRRSVHSLLAAHPLVAGFRLADGDRGGWGATLVILKNPHSSPCGNAGGLIA